MKKAGSFILLGIVIYGAVFPPRFPGDDPGFAMARVSVQFEARESLGLLEGLHNGFSAPGSVARSYCSFVWYKLIGESLRGVLNADTGLLGMLFLAVFYFFLGIVFAMLALLLHVVFGVALVFKLLFVATTPLYHLGFLAALGVVALAFAIAGKEEEPVRKLEREGKGTAAPG